MLRERSPTPTVRVKLDREPESGHMTKDKAVDPTADYRYTEKRPFREAVVLGLSWFFVYTSFQAIQNLQSSLHTHGGLGVASLACVYGSNFICSFFTPAIIYNVGVKKAICAAWVGHCLYVACNFYPHWATLIPGALIMGFLNCPLWTSLEIYMTTLARVHVAEKRGQTNFHASFSRLNGVFFSIFMGSQLSGNIISSTILFQSSYDNTGELQQEILEPGTTEQGSRCGINFCSTSGQHKKQIVPPDPHVVYALMAVFLTSEVIGLIVTAVWLPDLEQPRWKGRDVFRKIKSHIESLTNPRLWLLVPFLMSRMMNLALEVGTFTEAYISCTLGIRMVGFIMAVWGMATMASAVSIGWLARYTGRQVLCVSALAFDAIIFLVLTYWEPRENELNTFFALAVLMGLVEGIWVVQVNAIIASAFPNTADSAFAAKGMWSSLSMATTFLMATLFCPLTRIYVAILLIVVAMMGYLVLEIFHL